MRSYITILLCFIIGCSHQSTTLTSRVQLSSTAKAQLQWIAADARAMRDLADKVENGEITTMSEANEFSKERSVASKATFNKCFAAEAHKRFKWDSKSDAEDVLPEDAADIFRSFADEWDSAVQPLLKSARRDTDKKPVKKIKKPVRREVDEDGTE